MAIIRIHRPDITQEERERRIKAIEDMVSEWDWIYEVNWDEEE